VSNVYTDAMIKDTSDIEAYLIVMRVIRRGSEIFYHRGFTFWATKEIEQFGINNKNNLLNSVSFDEYIRIFYACFRSVIILYKIMIIISLC
jgi:hypothetical protein